LEVTPYGMRTDTIIAIDYPMKTWKDKAAFDETARKLVRMFQENFVKFEKHVDADVRSAAPEVRIAAE
jgi:phosphoenolpyruvate carboxykinase (ATP)